MWLTVTYYFFSGRYNSNNLFNFMEHIHFYQTLLLTCGVVGCVWPCDTITCNSKMDKLMKIRHKNISDQIFTIQIEI